MKFVTHRKNRSHVDNFTISRPTMYMYIRSIAKPEIVTAI